MTSEIPTLSIGSVLGDSDPTNNAWLLAIRELQRSVSAASENLHGSIKVNVVFHVDGKLAPNEFSGVRTGRFSAKKSLLMVQAAVPSEAQAGDHEVLRRLLSEAIDEAERFAVRRGIADDLNEMRATTKSLE